MIGGSITTSENDPKQQNGEVVQKYRWKHLNITFLLMQGKNAVRRNAVSR
jgi:hypothetical protein